jgi:hypothetical protein
MKANKTMRGQAVPNHRRRKNKESENSTDSTAYNQIFKQEKQINGMNHHIPININNECQWTQLPHQDTIWQTGLKRKINNLLFTRDSAH